MTLLKAGVLADTLLTGSADATLGGTNDIAGRAIVVLAREADLKTQRSGKSGGRLACGVIIRSALP